MPYAPLKKNKKDDPEKQDKEYEKQPKHKKGKNKNAKSSETSQKSGSTDGKNDNPADGIKVESECEFVGCYLLVGLSLNLVSLNNFGLAEAAVSVTGWLYAYLADP